MTPFLSMTPTEWKAARNQRIRTLRMESVSPAEIGKAFGLSKGGVGKILKQFIYAGDVFPRMGGHVLGNSKVWASGGQTIEMFTLTGRTPSGGRVTCRSSEWPQVARGVLHMMGVT